MLKKWLVFVAKNTAGHSYLIIHMRSYCMEIDVDWTSLCLLSCGTSGICLTMGKGTHHHDVQNGICLSQPFEDWMLEIMASCMRLCGLASHEWPNSCNLNLYMAAWMHHSASSWTFLDWGARNFFFAPHRNRHFVLGQLSDWYVFAFPSEGAYML